MSPPSDLAQTSSPPSSPTPTPSQPSLQIDDAQPSRMTRSQAINLYTSHFLSTWNVRSYEFAAIIFTAAAYPDTLYASSIRGIVRQFASICFSSAVGRWVDRSPHRLKTLSRTISVNRSSVIAASALWYFIVEPHLSLPNLAVPFPVKDAMFSIILILGILEKLSASGNMLSMERDFIVTAADPDGSSYDLTNLNAVMRRIDLICKLVAPLLISFIITATNVKIGVLVVGAMSVRVLKATNILDDFSNSSTSGGWSKITHTLSQYSRDFKSYFSSPVWIPSLSLSLLHLSALSYGATFITFLLASGFSLGTITFARAVGSVVEIGSTVVTPVGVRVLGRAKNHGRFRGRERSFESGDSGRALLGDREEEDGAVMRELGTETGLERLGLWGLSWQILNLFPVLLVLYSLTPTSSSPDTSPNLLTRILTSAPLSSIPRPLLTIPLFTFLSLSRLGLWTFDLTTTQLTQSLNPPSTLSSFTGVEYAFISLFELCQHILGIIWEKPEEFRWIAGVSVGSVLVSTVMYAGWVRGVRGHLVHWERFGMGCGKA